MNLNILQYPDFSYYTELNDGFMISTQGKQIRIVSLEHPKKTLLLDKDSIHGHVSHLEAFEDNSGFLGISDRGETVFYRNPGKTWKISQVFHERGEEYEGPHPILAEDNILIPYFKDKHRTILFRLFQEEGTLRDTFSAIYSPEMKIKAIPALSSYAIEDQKEKLTERFFDARKKGSVELVQKYLGNEILDPLEPDSNGWSALQWAVVNNQPEVVKILYPKIKELEEIAEKQKKDKKDEQNFAHELNEFDESKQNEINDYIQKIEELAKEKMLLEKQNEELTNNLSIANENLKELNDLVIDKYSNMENELYKQKTQKKNIEKKYKGMIKQIKSKEKGIVQENSQLKEILNNQDNSNKLQNLALYQNALGKDNLNRTMFNIPVNNNLLNDNNNNSVVIDSNNQRNILNNNTLNFANNKRINNIQNMPKLEDPNKKKKKKTLEEFKELLQKIDEKLDINKK